MKKLINFYSRNKKQGHKNMTHSGTKIAYHD